MKLTAVWSSNVYVAAVDFNGATNYSNFEANWGCDSEYSMASYAKYLSKPGYTLSGWKITVDGKSTTIGANGKIKNLTVEYGKKVMIQAQWKPNSYTITYSNGKGAKQSGAVKKYTTEAAVTIAAPTRTGYKFTGYTVTSKDKKANYARLVAVDENDPTKGYTLVAGSYGNILLTANWLKTDLMTSTYKIQILPGAAGVKTTDGAAVDEKNGISYNNGETVKYEDITTVLGTPDFVREGFVFKGYSYKKNGAVIENATVGGHDAKNGVVTLYVVWTVETNANILSGDAIVSGNTGSNLYVGSKIAALPAAKKTLVYGKGLTLPKLSVTGYKFLGWKVVSGKEDGLTKNKNGFVTKIGKNYNDKNLVLAPVFEQTKIKVTFNPQGGIYEETGNSKKVVIEVPYGTDINYLSKEYINVAKKGYVLSELAFDAKGKGSFAYADGRNYFSSSKATKAVTIYAIWTAAKPVKPQKVSAKLYNSGYLYTTVNDERLYMDCEVQIATDREFTKSVKTYDMGYADYEGISFGTTVSGNQYYARFRTYQVDSTGAKIYSDWSSTVMAIKDAAVDAE